MGTGELKTVKTPQKTELCKTYLSLMPSLRIGLSRHCCDAQGRRDHKHTHGSRKESETAACHSRYSPNTRTLVQVKWGRTEPLGAYPEGDVQLKGENAASCGDDDYCPASSAPHAPFHC
ncbi:hypothetical protein Taro_008169 [Colocasia esculenta]|uniref:Uncharacterized protein n=1 Tax=Colocasia esculenta TaxID=4460 RepID=A0A843U1P6_COLES|nr:hypothetical protein [Colocasia esculenta]